MSYYSTTRIMTKKTTILAVGIIALVIVALLLSGVFRQHPDEKEEMPIEVNRVGRVFIKDFYTLEGSINEGLQRRIENTLYSHISYDAPDLYTGTIRKDSYSSTSAGRVTIKKIMFDVYPTKVTYLVTVTLLNGNTSVIVSCAPREQQMNKTATCKDPEYI